MLAACAATERAAPPAAPGINMLSGAVTAVPRDDGNKSALAEAGRSARCVEEVEGRADFAALRTRSPEPAQMDFRHFSDEAMIGDDERAALRRYMEAIEPCRPHFGENAPDGIKRLFASTWTGQEKLYAELLARRVSWGEFNRRTHDLSQRAEEDARRLPASG
jgi:hypothetical protein